MNNRAQQKLCARRLAALMQCEQLFYTDAATALDPGYVDYPGELRIERLGKAKAFQISADIEQKKKKIIVLSDFSIWVDGNFKGAGCQLIEDLRDLGFEVRICQSGGVGKSKNEAIGYIVLNGYNDLIPSSELKEYFAAENIPADAILDLNYFALRKLLAQVYQQVFGREACRTLLPDYDELQNVLNLFDLFQKYSFTLPVRVQSALRNEKFVLRIKTDEFTNEKQCNEFARICLDVFKESINGLDLVDVTDIAFLKQVFGMARLDTLKMKYSQESLTPKFTPTKNDVKCMQLKRLWMHNVHGLFADRLFAVCKASLREVSIVGGNDLGFDGLDNAWQLKTAHLEYASIRAFIMVAAASPKQHDYAGLTELVIKDSPANQVRSILLKAKDLESLTIRKCMYWLPEHIPDDLELPNVRELNAVVTTAIGKREMQLPIGTYLKLLSKCKKVTHVDLHGVSLSNEERREPVSGLSQLELSHIKTVNFSGFYPLASFRSRVGSDYAESTIVPHFDFMGNVQKVDISETMGYFEPRILSEKVTHIDVSGTDGRLSKYLVRTPNIQEAIFDGCKNLFDPDELCKSYLHLEKLTKFSAHGSNIRFRDYILFLQACPQLKTLDLRNVDLDEMVSTNLDGLTLPLPQIEEVILCEHNELPTLLTKLMRCVGVNLKRIKSAAEKPEEGDSFNGPSNVKTLTHRGIRVYDIQTLPNLTEVDLSGLNFTEEHMLVNLLRAAVNLTSLDLQGCLMDSDTAMKLCYVSVTFAKLTSFRYEGSNLPLSLVIGLLSHVKSPGNKTLKLGRFGWPSTDIVRMLGMSPDAPDRYSFTKLHIGNKQINTICMAELLKLMPDLEELVIPEDSESNLGGITGPAFKLPPSFPRLQHLSLPVTNNPMGPAQLVNHMLAAAPNLRMLKIDGNWKPEAGQVVAGNIEKLILRKLKITTLKELIALVDVLSQMPLLQEVEFAEVVIEIADQDMSHDDKINHILTVSSFLHLGKFLHLRKIVFRDSNVLDFFFLMLTAKSQCLVEVKFFKTIIQEYCTWFYDLAIGKGKRPEGMYFALEHLEIDESIMSDWLLKWMVTDAKALRKVTIAALDKRNTTNLNQELFTRVFEFSTHEHEWPALQELNLRGQNLFCEGLIVTLRRLFPKLQKLHIEHCTGVGKPYYGIAILPELRELAISDCDITSKTMFEFIDNSPQLTDVHVSKCAWIKELKGGKSGTWSRQLRKIDISGAAGTGRINIETSFASWLIQNARTLEKLCITGCVIRQEDFLKLFTTATKLIQINMSGTVVRAAPLDRPLRFPATLDTRHCFYFDLIPDMHPELLLAFCHYYGISEIKLGFGDITFMAYEGILWRGDVIAPGVSKISFGSNHCSVDDLQKILQVATNCNEVTFENTSIDVRSALKLETRFPSVQRLVIRNEEYKSFSGVALIAWLQIFPNLIELSVNGKVEFTIAPYRVPSALHLPKLSKMTLVNTGLSQDVLHKLRSCAPQAAFKTNDLPLSGFGNGSGYGRGYGAASSSSSTQHWRSRATIKVGGESSGAESQIHLELDDNIVKKEPIMQRERFIPASDPTYTRLQVFTDFKIQDNKFIFCNPADLQLKSVSYTTASQSLAQEFAAKYQTKKENNGSYFFFPEDKFELTHEWQPLPAKTTQDKLVALYCDYSGKVEIKYSELLDLYYIRAIEHDAVVTCRVQCIYWVSDQPPQEQHIKSAPKEVMQLVEYCKFNNPRATILPKHLQGFEAHIEDILAWRYEKQFGRCEIRTSVCLFEYKRRKLNPGFVRVVSGYGHSFLEVRDGKEWRRIDLGGIGDNIQLQKIDVNKILKSDSSLLQTNNGNKTIDGASGLPSPTNSAGFAVIAEPANSAALVTPMPPMPRTEKSFFEKIIVPGKNSLVYHENTNDCLTIVAVYAKQFKKPYLFIDKPEDLQWSAEGLKANGLELTVQERFSRLRHFLTEHPDGVLFVNWSNFSPKEIAELKSIIDTDERTLESDPLPKSLCIVGFQSFAARDAYKESDLTSRHDVKCTWDLPAIADWYAERSKAQSTDAAELTIDLYGSKDWETLLFGPIEIHSNKFKLHESEFLRRLLKSDTTIKTLQLLNAPWHLREFQLFWQHALQQGCFDLYGKTYSVPEDFQLSHCERVNFAKEVVQTGAKPSVVTSLHNDNYHEFFAHYRYVGKQIQLAPGLLAENSALIVMVTEKLERMQWYRLLAIAKQNNVALQIQLPVEMELINELNSVATSEFKPVVAEFNNVDTLLEKPFAVVQTENPRDYVQLLLDKCPDALYVSIDEAHMFSDLLFKLHPRLSVVNGVEVDYIESHIWRALRNGQTVIIDGKLPRHIVNGFATMLVNGRAEVMINGVAVPFTGKLVFVTVTPLPFARNVFKASLSLQMQLVPNLRATNGSERIQAAAGLSDPANSAGLDKQSDSDNLSLAACEAFKTARFAALQNGFNKSHIIACMGATGIGKTTYILEQFEKDYFARTGRRAKLYVGMEQAEAFAAHADEDTDAFLFVDEANLVRERLTKIKSIKSQRPHLLLDGKYFHINGNQFVMLAGNPQEYGGCRQQQEFFAEHAEKVDFVPPNQAFLYHEIIKSQLTEAEDREDIARVILAIFNYVNAQDESKPKKDKPPSLSPRHLHMMAVFYQAYCQQFSEYDLTRQQLAVAACLAIIGDSLPENARDAFHNFLLTKYKFTPKQFSVTQTQYCLRQLQDKNKNAFTFTRSRYPALQMLDTILSIRKQPNFHFGILLTGSSGVGKSTFLKAYLLWRGVPFKQFSFTKNYESDRHRLLDAFNAGEFVITDEINAGGLERERLINTVTMGKDEEGNAVAPENKGFAMAATQNKITLAGRRALSAAMSARFIDIELPSYELDELVEILVNYNVAPQRANYLAQLFMTRMQEASEHNRSEPNMRDLLRDAGVVLDSVFSEHGVVSNHDVRVEAAFAEPVAMMPHLNETVQPAAAVAPEPAPAPVSAALPEPKAVSQSAPEPAPVAPSTTALALRTSLSETLLEQLKTYADLLKDKYTQNPTGFFALRWEDKYRAMNDIVYFAERDQLTEAKIADIERACTNMYSGLFSKTEQLIKQAKMELQCASPHPRKLC